MSQPPPLGPGYGRGGRGAALLKAMQEPVRQPGQLASPTQQAGAAPAPMGRGAMLAHMQAAVAGRGAGLIQPPATAGAQPSPMGRGMMGSAPPMGRGMVMGRGMPVASAAVPPAAATPPPAPMAAPAAAPAPTVPLGRGAAMALGRGRGAALGMPPVATPSPVTSPPRPVAAVQPTTVPPAPAPSGPQGDQPRTDAEGKPWLTKLEYMLQNLSTDDPVVKKGKDGQAIPVMANCIPVRCSLKGVYQYAVSFNPQIDSKGMRFRLIDSDQVKEIIGQVRAFDGAILFLPLQLPEAVVDVVTQRLTDNAEITVTIKLVKTIPPAACLQLYNVVFRKAMSHLKLCQVGRHYYDSHNTSKIPAHRLEVWPGYITAISETEGGLMLLTDVSHRVLRTETVLDKFMDIYRNVNSKEEFHKRASQATLGVTVLTRYNNKTYRVDDIDWNQSPKSTFQMANGEETSYVDYYRRNYKIEIKEPEQPLLLHRPKKKDEQRGGRSGGLEVICLIPELCNMTGLTDDMRSDFRVMKDLGAHTRVVPHERRNTLRKLCENLSNHPDCKAELAKWGLAIELDVLKTDARLLPPEKIHFRSGQCVPQNADWGRDATRNQMIVAVDLRNWAVVHVNRDERRAQDFISMMMQVAPQLGMNVARPDVLKLDNDRTDAYLQALKRLICPERQLVVTIFPTSRDDRYAAVKKHCCETAPIASQVIISKTIGDQKKMRSVVQKIALQINCKLGGELWAVDIPVKGLMVIGIDVYHDKARQGQSIAGFVASINRRCTRWHSTVCHQMAGQELSHGLKTCFTEALKKYNQENHELPSRIVIYRDGVGDGQLKVVAGYEVPQLASCFAQFGEAYQPKLAMVVVQKRINQKIFAVQRQGKLDNPPPGTILDHTITRKEWYDFFLVSQFVRQGTVNPTHYVVVHDTLNWDPDKMQRLSYKLTHLYYNWPGTIRTPAPCQYAHKLAYLVGQCIHKTPSSLLSDRLFFL